MRFQESLLAMALIGLLFGACSGPHHFECKDIGALEGEIEGWCICGPGTVQVEYRCLAVDGGQSDASAVTDEREMDGGFRQPFGIAKMDASTPEVDAADTGGS